ncbi:hypothetical protein CCX46_04450 [Pseudomonas sp. RU47]|nr:hypothetical protein CCX46_04450 [Pseudomonas sp. RU47]
MIVPMLRVGMPHWMLCVRFRWDAERPGLRSHAERGNDHESPYARIKKPADDYSSAGFFLQLETRSLPLLQCLDRATLAQ